MKLLLASAVMSLSFGVVAKSEATQTITLTKVNESTLKISNIESINKVDNLYIDGAPLKEIASLSNSLLSYEQQGKNLYINFSNANLNSYNTIAISVDDEIIKETESFQIKEQITLASGGELQVNGWIKYSKYKVVDWFFDTCEVVRAPHAKVYAYKLGDSSRAVDSTTASSNGAYQLNIPNHNGRSFQIWAEYDGSSNFGYAKSGLFCGDSSDCTDKVNLTVFSASCSPNNY